VENCLFKRKMTAKKKTKRKRGDKKMYNKYSIGLMAPINKKNHKKNI